MTHYVKYHARKSRTNLSHFSFASGVKERDSFNYYCLITIVVESLRKKDRRLLLYLIQGTESIWLSSEEVNCLKNIRRMRNSLLFNRFRPESTSVIYASGFLVESGNLARGLAKRRSFGTA
jgi:hypothetical protein